MTFTFDPVYVATLCAHASDNVGEWAVFIVLYHEKFSPRVQSLSRLLRYARALSARFRFDSDVALAYRQKKCGAEIDLDAAEKLADERMAAIGAAATLTDVFAANADASRRREMSRRSADARKQNSLADARRKRNVKAKRPETERRAAEAIEREAPRSQPIDVRTLPANVFARSTSVNFAKSNRKPALSWIERGDGFLPLPHDGRYRSAWNDVRTFTGLDEFRRIA